MYQRERVSLAHLSKPPALLSLYFWHQEFIPRGFYTLHGMLSFPNWSCMGYPQATVLQVLLQHGSVPRGLPFRTTVLYTGPHRWQLPQPCSTVGSSAPARGCSCGGSPCIVPPPGLISCCSKGLSMAAGGDLQTVPMDHRGNSMLQHGPLLSCRGASAVCLELLLPLILHWPWCLQGLFLSHFSLVSPSYTAVFPFLKICCPRGTPSVIHGLALVSSGSLSEPVGVGSYLCLALLRAATPVAPTATKIKDTE